MEINKEIVVVNPIAAVKREGIVVVIYTFDLVWLTGRALLI